MNAIDRKMATSAVAKLAKAASDLFDRARWDGVGWGLARLAVFKGLPQART